MATAVAVATRPASVDTIPVQVPRRLVRRMGLERLRLLLERLDEDTQHLEDAGGGQLQATVDVRGRAAGGGVGEVYTAPRRRLGPS